MVRPERLTGLNRKPVRQGRYVLYWMQASQRASFNPALDHAIDQANAMGLPVVACFGLMDDYPEANERHYAFMLEGLAETARDLEQRGVPLVLRRGRPGRVAASLADEAALVVADVGYLRHQRVWRRELGRAIDCRAVQVEADVAVPVRLASDKAESAARTLRPRLHKHWPDWVKPEEPPELQCDGLGLDLGGLDPTDTQALLRSLTIDRDVPRVSLYRGGLSRARDRLKRFVAGPLGDYAERRNHPELDIQSHMSPYLHFGQISPLEIAQAVRAAKNAGAENIDAYLEELLVRRELSMNHAYYQDRYDAWDCLPGWARKSLRQHQDDDREHVYTFAQLDAAETHDPWWNAAMTEMRITGTMHNYMRMYWGKKILQWTRSPRTAFRWTLQLNNRYFLDGRDPVSFANVAWCFGLHDRPWGERPIFGLIRYMSINGLERKFDMPGYERRVAELVKREQNGE